MTPKEKANELFNELQKYLTNHGTIKSCAIFAINLKIENLPNINMTPPIKRLNDVFYMQYWEEVKSELKKL